MSAPAVQDASWLKSHVVLLHLGGGGGGVCEKCTGVGVGGGCSGL